MDDYQKLRSALFDEIVNRFWMCDHNGGKLEERFLRVYNINESKYYAAAEVYKERKDFMNENVNSSGTLEWEIEELTRLNQQLIAMINEMLDKSTLKALRGMPVGKNGK